MRAAKGAVIGDGVGIVVLKRLAARRRRGHDRAVIKGSADQQRRLGEGGLHGAERRRAGAR